MLELPLQTNTKRYSYEAKRKDKVKLKNPDPPLIQKKWKEKEPIGSIKKNKTAARG